MTITLQDLLLAVKEKNLSKEQIEAYRDDLVYLYADLSIEAAELEKAEALFFLANKEWEKGKRPDVEIKRMWRGSESGQRLIVVSRYLKAVEKVIASLRSRLYTVL